MAGPYFVDPGASGGATGADWTNAFTSIAAALAVPPAAGETIYCRKSGGGVGETIATKIFFSSSGSNAAGWIKVIGCNSDGEVDGTRYVIDGGGNNISILDTAGNDLIWCENIEVKNTGTTGSLYGIYNSTGSSAGCIFINCCANGCQTAGISATAFADGSIFFRCVSYSNTGTGFLGYGSNAGCGTFYFCVSRDNAVDGFDIRSANLNHCVSHGNTDDGVQQSYQGGAGLINCVIDGNGDDGFVQTAGTGITFNFLLGCRITNQSAAGSNGLISVDDPIIVGYSYFEDNDDNIAGASHDAAPNATFQFLPIENETTTTNLEDRALDDGTSDEGYVDKANHNFSTDYQSAHATQVPRRTAITLPWS